MEPLATADRIDLSAPHVLAIVLAAVVVTLIGVLVRKAVMTYGDELKVLWGEYGPIAVRRLLQRRRMPQTPWYCARCRSHNARGHSRCYACGARREEAEAPVPDSGEPGGIGAGGHRRTRR